MRPCPEHCPSVHPGTRTPTPATSAPVLTFSPPQILQPAAVRLALLACLAFRADINERSTFDRKHYFYPDLTTGFQVTQKYGRPKYLLPWGFRKNIEPFRIDFADAHQPTAPLAMNGTVRVKKPPPKKKRKGGSPPQPAQSAASAGIQQDTFFDVRLEQIQLEQVRSSGV